jgi:hypothetical protein
MMETKISKTNSENVAATQKELSIPIIIEQIPSKRIRKRIKYNRPALSEVQVKSMIHGQMEI